MRSKMSSPTPQSAAARRRRGRRLVALMVIERPGAGVLLWGHVDSSSSSCLRRRADRLAPEERRYDNRDRDRAYQRPKRLHACAFYINRRTARQRPRTLRQISPRPRRLRPCRCLAGIWPLPFERPLRIASSDELLVRAPARPGSGPTRATAFAAFERVAEPAAAAEELLPVLLLRGEAGHLRVRDVVLVRRRPRSPRAGTTTPSTSSDAKNANVANRRLPRDCECSSRTQAAAPAAHGEQERSEAEHDEGQRRRRSVLTGRAIYPLARST